MMLSKMTTAVLIDLIENKLAMLQIGDRNDLREVLTLQRCLGELRDLDGLVGTESARAPEGIPTRGRHRKLTELMDEMSLAPAGAERQSA